MTAAASRTGTTHRRHLFFFASVLCAAVLGGCTDTEIRAMPPDASFYVKSRAQTQVADCLYDSLRNEEGGAFEVHNSADSMGIIHIEGRLNGDAVLGLSEYDVTVRRAGGSLLIQRRGNYDVLGHTVGAAHLQDIANACAAPRA
ncbi:MAG TPA: hypothetical protein VHW02_04030 [Rhizomicrobium sp.]|jgi:hypothetical protein|nr:hypothetical protein [Rhizomicrobium sp.]